MPPAVKALQIWHCSGISFYKIFNVFQIRKRLLKGRASSEEQEARELLVASCCAKQFIPDWLNSHFLSWPRTQSGALQKERAFGQVMKRGLMTPPVSTILALGYMNTRLRFT